MKKLSFLALASLPLVLLPGGPPADAATPLPATAALATAPAMAAPRATGVIEGRVALEPRPAPRRTASRYPGGQAGVHLIQELPAVVYLVGPLPGRPPSPSELRAEVVQRDTAFVPPAVVVRVGGTVSFPNGDPFFHNVFSYSSAMRFDLGRYPQGETKEVTFSEPGVVEVFCEVHEFMRGAVIVAENPYHAVVGEDGTFRISGVPEGEHTLAIWHPDHHPYRQRVVVPPGGTARLEVSLER
ncbi:MAG TPA: carboxypeptidase regulatory-like domain-containing protein [Longimicrobiales bacterium]|nr:carboxypeptidase regulatory-like domain-containing protein [Longimicrobiales bacterium]